MKSVSLKIQLIISTGILLGFLKPISFAKETTKAGTAAAQFLKIGVGAQAQAMGGVLAGISGTVASLYWNPAGIADINQVAWLGTHTNWLADVTHQFTGLVVPLGHHSALGFSATLVNMGEEEITTIENPQGTGLFWDAADLALGIAYAVQLTDRFRIGVTGKYIHQKIYHETAATFALDVGTLLRTGFKGLSIGMCFSNFGGDLQLEGRDLIRAYDPNPANSRNDDVDARLHTESWPLPVNFRVGIAIELIGDTPTHFIRSKHQRVTLAIDANHPNDAAENIRFGLEYEIRRLIIFRSGYKFNEDLVNFTFGGGLKFNLQATQFIIDYALAAYGELDYVNFVSLGCSF